MRPDHVFDVCHQKVRDYMYVSPIGAIPLEPRTSGGPARVGNWRSEYIADFRHAAKRALLQGRRPGRKPKPMRDLWQLFEAYFMTFPPNASFGEEVSSAELLNEHGKRVQKQLKYKTRTFYLHIQQIKQLVGAEIARSGLFPPRKYQCRKLEPVEIED